MSDEEFDEIAVDELSLEYNSATTWYVDGALLLKNDVRMLLQRVEAVVRERCANKLENAAALAAAVPTSVHKTIGVWAEKNCEAESWQRAASFLRSGV